MKIFGAINDGYRFIYSKNPYIIEDWLFIHQENFCILKIFEIEVPSDTILVENCDLYINKDFNKKNVPQTLYNDVLNMQLNHETIIHFNDGLAQITDNNKDKNEVVNVILNYEEQVILKATRIHQEIRK